MNFALNDRVTLKKFLGEINPPHKVKTQDNYWKLIGEMGSIVKLENQSKMPKHPNGPRVLIKFDSNVNNFGLSCHNEIENSLWIFISDLK
ncbi:hypothetical protein [Acidovorax sp. SUPP2825]|uniref:hypothetical protein n=1 Tax=Acidovorax sp. SUPP2825 TaxID=2920879 RepID=UPI0023DE310A|nr:hypothetical protein [Acidovorax sp. SUPP2825]GKS97660.1 hypothetical protein AVAK2825_24015 [Acidovorax sp. SUPP2825]